MSLERPDYLNESSPADPDLNIREEPSVANVDEPPRYEVAFFSPEFMEVIEENRRMEHELLEHWQSDADSGDPSTICTASGASNGTTGKHSNTLKPPSRAVRKRTTGWGSAI